MGTIERETITHEVYVSSDGRRTPLQQMADPHLVNAFGQSISSLVCSKLPESDYERGIMIEARKLVDSLRAEILRRLSLCKSNSAT